MSEQDISIPTKPRKKYRMLDSDFYRTAQQIRDYRKEHPQDKMKGITLTKVFRLFGQKMSKKIIEDYYVFEIGYGLGYLSVVRSDRIYKKNINGDPILPIAWKNSFETKRAIIEQGGTPYKAIKNELGQTIGNNGGVKWLQYHTDGHFVYWFWEKIMSNITKEIKIPRVTYGKVYRFNPSHKNRRDLAALTKEQMLGVRFRKSFIPPHKNK